MGIGMAWVQLAPAVRGGGRWRGQFGCAIARLRIHLYVHLHVHLNIRLKRHLQSKTPSSMVHGGAISDRLRLQPADDTCSG